MVCGVQPHEVPRRGVHAFDAVFGREVLVVAPQAERVFVVAVEVQESRGAEQHGFDMLERGPLAQDRGVGHAPRQFEVGRLVAAVAQRAEEEQIEGLIPVLARLGVELAHGAELAGQAVVGQRREDLGAVQRIQPGQIRTAGACSGTGPEAVEHPCYAFLHAVRAGSVRAAPPRTSCSCPTRDRT